MEQTNISMNWLMGNGASHNNLFSIDENGGVLTTKLFDYETDAQSMSIRARATDPYGKSVENTFSISLVNHDRFSPVSIDQGLMLWLDAGDPTTMDKGQSLGELGQPRNGEDVKFWADKSGNLHHAISETAATYMTDALSIVIIPQWKQVVCISNYPILRRHLMLGIA